MYVPVSGKGTTSSDGDGLGDGAVAAVIVAVNGSIDGVQDRVVTGVRTTGGILTGSYMKRN